MSYMKHIKGSLCISYFFSPLHSPCFIALIDNCSLRIHITATIVNNLQAFCNSFLFIVHLFQILCSLLPVTVCSISQMFHKFSDITGIIDFLTRHIFQRIFKYKSPFFLYIYCNPQAHIQAVCPTADNLLPLTSNQRADRR